MPVEYFIRGEPEHQPEYEAIVKLAQAMQAAFTATDRFYLLAVNARVGDRQADAVVLMPHAIVWLELKSCHDPVIGDADHAWRTTEGSLIRGGKSINPYQQVKTARGALMKYLDRKRTKFMDKRRAEKMQGCWGQTSAAIVFSPFKHEESRFELPGTEESWLRIIGLNEVPDYLYTRRSLQIDLLPQEMRQLVMECMGCKPWTDIEPLLSPAATYGHLWLLDEAGERTYPFPLVDSARIGRSGDNELLVPHRFDHTSRHHAHLRVKGDVVYLYKDQDRHGTFVGEQPVPEHGLALDDGAVIWLGDVNHPRTCRLLVERKLRLVNVVEPTASTTV